MRPLLLLLPLMAACAPAPSVPFDVFLSRVEAAAPQERAPLAEAFWQSLARTPLVESDTTAVVLWKGEAGSVGVLGDMGAWAETLPLARVDGTDLWFRRLRLEPDARLEYLFMVDDDRQGFGSELAGVPDPRNPHRVLSGFGPFSELAMPDYPYSDVFASVRGGTPGSFDGLDLHTLPPGALPYEHEILVYTPPGWTPPSAAASGSRPPLAVFMDGRDYVEFAHAPAVLDDLIRRGEIEPVVAVFVDPPNRNGSESPNRTTEYGLNDAFVAFLADELVPFVEARYGTRREPASRLIVGDSYGGLIATYVPFRRPDVFGLGVSQSGYHSFQGDRMIRLVESEPVAPIRLVVEVGTYETSVGAGWLPDDENDFLAANRRMRDALEKKGYDFVYAEVPEGHTWGHWRGRLAGALRHLFPARGR